MALHHDFNLIVVLCGLLFIPFPEGKIKNLFNAI